MLKEMKEFRDQFDADQYCQINIDDDEWKEKPKEMNFISDSILNRIRVYNGRSKKQKQMPIISRVPESIRNKHVMEYEPEVIAIGPYHGNNGSQGEEINSRLKAMEDKKLEFLQNLCKRGAKNKRITVTEVLNNITIAVQLQESNARNMYSKSLSEMSSEDFVQMMVFDGCCIMELMFDCWNQRSNKEENNDYNLSSTRALFQGNENDSVLRDLLLFENQIPFFILETIFCKCSNSSSKFGLIDLALKYLLKVGDNNRLPKTILPPEYLKQHNPAKIDHFLHLLHIVSISQLDLSNFQSKREPKPKKIVIRFIETIFKLTQRILEFLLHILMIWDWECWKSQEFKSEFMAHSIPTATQLHGNGVKFQIKEMNGSDHYFNVTFKKEDGIMEVPYISINDKISTWLCNFMALEHAYSKYGKKITCYVLFMVHLIETSDDVALLTKEKVIENDVGSMKKVANLFNDMRNGFVSDISDDKNFYKLYQDVNNYCKSPMNEWRAVLKQNYFSSPWSLIALWTAAFILFMTLLQTICSIVQTIYSIKYAPK